MTSLYALGLEDEVGVIKYGPGDVRQELDSTNSLFAAVNARIWSSKADDAFKANWQELYREWIGFYDGNFGAGGVVSQFRDSTFERSRQYRAAAEKYRDALDAAEKAAGTAPPAPSGSPPANANEPSGSRLHVPVPDISLPAVSLGFPWRAVLTVAAVGFGGLFVIRTVRDRR